MRCSGPLRLTRTTRHALDHLTLVDAEPLALARTAAETGYRGISCFLRSMDVLPSMPVFDLPGDPVATRALSRELEQSGIALDLVYPFTLSHRVRIEDFGPALDCAAALGARFANVLSYDRDPSRRDDQFAAFCDLAEGRGIGTVLEFFPRSAVATLEEALRIAGGVGRGGRVGVNVDLLHLVRSGGSLTELATAPTKLLLYAQLCDGPAECPEEERDHEASRERLLPGAGVFDIGGFKSALPITCLTSIEAPSEAARLRGSSLETRARLALESILSL